LKKEKLKKKRKVEKKEKLKKIIFFREGSRKLSLLDGHYNYYIHIVMKLLFLIEFPPLTPPWPLLTEL
jgi:hypothetical protein